MGVMVFENEEKSIREYGEVLKFWSNGIGELHNPKTMADIAYDGLPEELKRVYDELYWEPIGGASLRYFVETDKGYGIALLNEYDTVTAESSGVAFGPLFETVVEDARNIGLDPAFENCEVFAGECLGFDGCHELVVVFPWNTPSAAFVEAANKLDEFVYVACGINKPLKDAAQDKGERIKDKGEELSNSQEFDNKLNGGLSLEEKLGNAKEESVRMVTEAVRNVGDFVEDDGMKRGLNKAAVLRNKALEACYKIPGYEKLPREDKNALYDLVKKAVEKDMGLARDFVMDN